ncbi:hypothetical protein B0H66DRAFT_38201 [Apodospora peruviana]|uniref:Uncharacterized protein n=1 Tax=Apodospora peruviana TaxID=516989 RepID=A0AAE0MFI5_9PEZI|nr:hypothetical protein B0H66DRAFT_38201 [Apodospora peruviana]
MGAYISVEQANLSHGPVDSVVLSEKLSKRQRGLLRLGLVRSHDWTELPIEGIYQIVISEVLETGSAHALVHGGSRAFAVTAVLDLGLRMLESPRGRTALQNLARRTFHCFCEKEKDSSMPHDCPDSHPPNLPMAVAEFLRSVRYRFPSVTLDKCNGLRQEKGAAPGKYDDFWCDEIPTLEKLKFNPKEEAVLHLNWEMIDKLYWTRLKADMSAGRDSNGADHNMIRFRRLQFHLGIMVAHHLCHLFIGFLRSSETLSAHVDDVRILRLVNRYDAGAEFETDFFGGRPKMFIDFDGPAEERYAGQSYLVKRGDDSRRIAAVIPQERIENYLKGDFSLPLLTTTDEMDAEFELFRDVKKRYPASSHERKDDDIADLGRARKDDDPKQLFSLPWDVKGEEYRLLKRACHDPSVRLVDTHGF